MPDFKSYLHRLITWLMEASGEYPPSLIAELPQSERVDLLGLIIADYDTQPIKPIDTLECLNCGAQIELKYYGYHTEWCGIYDEFYRKPEDQELPF